MKCPKCEFEQPDDSLDCARCGIVFSKWAEPGEPPDDLAPGVWVPPPPSDAPVEDPLMENGTIGRTELTILGTGLAAAVVAHLVPITRWAFFALKTLFHEIGHAVVAWILGQPAIPAFDFAYGGGITHISDFQPLLAVFIFAGLAWLAWTVRPNRKSLTLVVIVIGIWLIAVSAGWRRETVVAAAGVTGELILAAVLFYMALSGHGFKIPEIERPLGAFAAFFVQIATMIFAWRLGHDPDFLSFYLEGKGGALMNDLEVVALNLHIYTPLNPGIEGLSNLLLFFSLVPIGVALLLYLKRESVHRFARSLLTA